MLNKLYIIIFFILILSCKDNKNENLNSNIKKDSITTNQNKNSKIHKTVEIEKYNRDDDLNSSAKNTIITDFEINQNKNGKSPKTAGIKNNKFITNKIEIAGELKIPINNTTTFRSSNIQYIASDSVLITMPDESNTLNIYDLNKKTQLNTIKLHKEGPNSIHGTASAFYYHNKDSIFVMTKYIFKVSLINSEGQVKDSYQIIDDFVPELPIPIANTLRPMIYRDNKLYLVGDAATKKVNGKYNNTFIEYDIVKHETSFKGKVPSRFNLGSWERISGLYCDYIPIQNTFILSHTISDSLILYNNNNGSEKKVRAGNPFFDEDDIKPFSTSFKETNDFMVRAKYMVATPHYRGVLYDKYRNVYYRFSILANTFSDWSRRKSNGVVITVFDENFNEIAHGKYSPFVHEETMCFINEKGLQIANKVKYSEDDNFITFDTFVLK